MSAHPEKSCPPARTHMSAHPDYPASAGTHHDLDRHGGKRQSSTGIPGHRPASRLSPQPVRRYSPRVPAACPQPLENAALRKLVAPLPQRQFRTVGDHTTVADSASCTDRTWCTR